MERSVAVDQGDGLQDPHQAADALVDPRPQTPVPVLVEPLEQGPTQAPVLTAASHARIESAISSARAEGTRRAYRADWARFDAWCARHAHLSLPAHPMVLADYLTEHAARRTTATPRAVGTAETVGSPGGEGVRSFAVSTLSRWVSSINQHHRAAGYLPPGEHEIVRSTLAGLRREYAAAGDRPVRRREPLITGDLRALLEHSRATAVTWQQQIAERRDSALLLLGQPGAFRRGELVALNTGDVSWERGYGLHITVRRSKTDPDGHGLVKALPFGRHHQTCPGCAYARWREVLDAWDTGARPAVIAVLHHAEPFTDHIHQHANPHPNPSGGSWAGGSGAAGPDIGGSQPVAVFRGVHRTGAIAATRLSAESVNAVLRRRAIAAGLPASLVQLLGGHSMRAGFVTEAKAHGADDESVMAQTGHTTTDMVRLYTRHHLPQLNNAVARLGL